MHPYLNIATNAARKAGNIIAHGLERVESLELTKKQHNDFATEIDIQAEKAIIEIIRTAYPNHSILGEEGGKIEGNEVTWIIDPLDGTTNFIHRFPHFAVSIAVQMKDRLEFGLVYDPMRHEFFTAVRGQGAQLNNRRIRVSKQTNLQGALLGTGFPYRNLSRLDSYMKTLHTILPEVSGVRRAGSAALDLAYVAAGRLDGYWEYDLAPWDIAAGALIVTEAGGLVSDEQGAENYLTSGNIVAGNPKIFKAVLQQINGSGK
jgi:myo-inositol-1(or 4)-monophosphatase